LIPTAEEIAGVIRGGNPINDKQKPIYREDEMK